jgi:hypothetical protein
MHYKGIQFQIAYFEERKFEAPHLAEPAQRKWASTSITIVTECAHSTTPFNYHAVDGLHSIRWTMPPANVPIPEHHQGHDMLHLHSTIHTFCGTYTKNRGETNKKKKKKQEKTHRGKTNCAATY